MNRAVEARERAINSLLADALLRNPAIKLNKLLQTFEPGNFDDTQWRDLAPPDPKAFAPGEPELLVRLLPGASKEQARKVIEGQRQFELALAAYKERLKAKAAALAIFEADEHARRSKVDRHNASVREFRKALEAREHLAVVSYFKSAIGRTLKDEPNAISVEVGYSANSRHLVVDLELPEISVVPDAMRYRRLELGRRV